MSPCNDNYNLSVFYICAITFSLCVCRDSMHLWHDMGMSLPGNITTFYISICEKLSIVTESKNKIKFQSAMEVLDARFKAITKPTNRR